MASISGPVRRRRGRPPKSEAGDTKAELLAAALRLFARKGYAGTSIRAIAREVGLSESVLYAHFASKRAIFEALLARQGPHGVGALVEEVDTALADSDPAEFVRTLVARFAAAWDTEESRLFMSLMAQDGMTHDPMLLASIEEVLKRLGGVFERWIESGAARADLGAPQDLAHALIAPIGIARVLWLNADTTEEQRAAALERLRRHAEFFIRAVFRPAGD